MVCVNYALWRRLLLFMKVLAAMARSPLTAALHVVRSWG